MSTPAEPPMASDWAGIRYVFVVTAAWLLAIAIAIAVALLMLVVPSLV